MSHIGNERDWDGLIDFYLSSHDYPPSLKKVTLAQWILESRRDATSAPGTSELAIDDVNFCRLPFNKRMEEFGAGKYISGPTEYCKFDDVEHFIDGYYYFISSTDYPKWHLLADRPIDFISYLQEQGFHSANETYVEDIKAIYDSFDYGLSIPETPVIRHVVSHGEYIYQIAEKYNAPPENLFRVGQNGSVQYGTSLGSLRTGDLLYVLPEAQPEIAGFLADPLGSLNPCDRPAGDCAGRTHFVIHQTVDGTLTKTKVIEHFGGKRGKGHAYVLKSGEAVFLWPFTEKTISATKSEFPNVPKHKPIKGKFPDFAVRGKLIHVETDYEENGKPTEAQYNTLAKLYIDACTTVGRLLTIVPHIEIDRGIRNGHNDPQNFDYNHFYDVLQSLGVRVERIPRFAHERYWGKPNYKTPWDTDTFHFPPTLTGNPHA